MKKQGDTLLQDAIAEAKQVKAAALANARIVLEEAFKPHLASMLTAKLRNEMEDHTKNDAHGTEDGGETDVKAVVEQNALKSSEIGTSDNKPSTSAAKSSSNIDNPGQELDTMGDGSQGVDHKIGGTNPAPQGSDAHPEKLHEAEFGDDEEGDEVDLDFDGGDDMAGPETGMGGDMEMGADDFGGGDVGGDDMGMGDMGGDQGGDLGSDDIESLIRELEAEVLAMTQGGPAPEQEMAGMAPMTEDESATADAEGHEHTVSFGDEAGKAPVGTSQTLKLSEEELREQSLEELLREMDVADQTKADHYAHKVNELQAENVTLKRRLKEHRGVVLFLKDRINEINMLNAKLLFTNKLFKQFDLNGGQKMRVVETFDRATTLREIKLVYTTLVETYASKRPGKSSVKQITEGIASKAVASTKPKSAQVLTESADSQIARFQKLAGIIKS